MRSACSERSPCEKLSRATFSPARMSRSSISGASEAGPIVATILVLLLGSAIRVPIKRCLGTSCGVLFSMSALLREKLNQRNTRGNHPFVPLHSNEYAEEYCRDRFRGASQAPLHALPGLLGRSGSLLPAAGSILGWQ